MITLYRGDDAAFRGVKRLRVTVETKESLAGCCAEFELCGIVKRVPDVSTGSFYLALTGEDTRGMPLGVHSATLRVFDEEGRRRTVSNAIRVCVTERVEAAYAGDDAINVALGATVAWRSVADKPSINGVVLEGDKSTSDLGIKGVVKAELVDLPEAYTPDDLRAALNRINACLRASMASVAAMLLSLATLALPCAGLGAATETNRVERARLGGVSSLTDILTDVCLDGLATEASAQGKSDAALSAAKVCTDEKIAPLATTDDVKDAANGAKTYASNRVTASPKIKDLDDHEISLNRWLVKHYLLGERRRDNMPKVDNLRELPRAVFTIRTHNPVLIANMRGVEQYQYSLAAPKLRAYAYCNSGVVSGWHIVHKLWL